MKKIKYILSIWVLVLPLMINAQSAFLLNDFQVDTNHNVIFGIRSEAFINSTALSGKATGAGLFGGYITPEERQFMLDRASTENNVGQFVNASMYFAKRIDTLFGKQKSGLSFFINVADRQESNALFSKNALDLIVFGNKQFAGEFVEFGELGFNQLHYNQFQLGLNKTYKNEVQVGFGASFLYGQTNQKGYAPTLNIHTSESGDLISGQAEMLMYQTDPNNSNTFAYNGAGASIDLSGNFPINLNHRILKDARFTAAVYDLGFISWHGSSEKYSLDGPFDFSGVHVENIFGSENETNTDLGEYVDSLFAVQNVSYTAFTPITIKLELKQEFAKSVASVGFIYRHHSYFYPYLYGKYGHQIGENWDITAQINFGGYGKLGGGLELKYTGDHMDVKLGSTNIEGFLNPTKWAGQSIYILLGFKL